MKRKFLIWTVALLIGVPAIGQVSSQQRKGLRENNLRLFDLIRVMAASPNVLADANRFDLDKIDGTMYYDERFREGKVYYKDEPLATVPMRYNAYTDIIEIKRPEESNAEALRQDTKVFCQMNKERFSYMEFVNKKGQLEKGYLVSMWSGKNYQLYERRTKTFHAGQVQKTSFHMPTPDKFIEWNAYYISKNGSMPIYMKASKKGITPIFGKDKKKEIESYIKENKLDLSEKRDLTKLLWYADTIAQH